MEHKTYPKIEHIDRLECTITQKLDGTNAQILVYEEGEQHMVLAGSRNRWLSVDTDNFGFAKWVADNQKVLVEFLGPGRHYGEWCGPGINNGEGLEERTLVLFDYSRYTNKPLPKNVLLVPVLYQGPVNDYQIDSIKRILEATGSRLVPGHTETEGIVINIAGKAYKSLYRQEIMPAPKPPKASPVNIYHLLQPRRVHNLLSKDERYLKQYPFSIGQLVKDYIIDLEQENQLSGDENERRLQKKSLGRHGYAFIKEEIDRQYATSKSEPDDRCPITDCNFTG